MRQLLLFCFFIISLHSVADTYTTFEEKGKIGLKNEDGQVIIPPKYEALGWSNGSFSIKDKVTGYKVNGVWGVLNLNDQHVTPADYISLTPAEGSLIIASKQSTLLQISTGCIDVDGKIIIPFTYTGIKIHSLRVVAFLREGNLFKHGLIDLENKVLIPFRYKNIYPIGSLRYAVEDFQGKTALFSESGTQITGFSIDSLSQFNNNLAIIYEAGKQGLINREGQLQSEAKYREILISGKSVHVRLPDQWSILDGTNRLLQLIEADSLVSLGENRYKIESAGRSFLVGPDFKINNGTGFSLLLHFQNSLSIYKSNDKYGVIKRNGNILLPAVYQTIVQGTNYFLTQEKNIDKITWALYDTSGHKKTVKSYDLITHEQNSNYPVLKNGFWGVINNQGNEIVACVYDSLLEFQDNQIALKFKGQYGIINTKEEWLAYPQSYSLKLLNADRYIKKIGNTLFICSFTGTVLYFTDNPIQIKDTYFIESVSTGGTWTIDFDGRIITRQLPPAEPTEEVFPSTEGLRGIKKDGRFGFIDQEGRLRIANRYENIKPFSEGLAAVKLRNRWGFINRDEEIVIQPSFDSVTPFIKGHAQIRQGEFYGLVNRSGDAVLPARYQAIHVQDNGRLLISMNNVRGLADANGNVLLQPKYSSVQDLNNGYVIIQQEDKYGLVTIQGVSTIPLAYDKIIFDLEQNRYLALRKSEWMEFKK